MDLSRMSRDALNAEGRKIGIWMPSRLSRAALEARIREHHDAPLRKAGRALKKMIGIARDLRESAPRLRLGAPAPAPAPKPEARPQPTPEAKPTATPKPTPKPKPKPMPEAKPTPTLEAKPTPTPAPEAKPSAKSQPVSEAGSAPASGSRSSAGTSGTGGSIGSLQEPIETRTMAKILADQGYRRRALAIYRKLVDQSPDDADLRAEMKAVRESKKPADDDEDPERDECVAVAADDHAVVAWKVGDAAVARAARLCGEGATLVLRSIVLSTVEGAVEREVAELPVELAGEQAFDIEHGQRLIAAIGLRRDERFVSIAHAPPLTL